MEERELVRKILLGDEQAKARFYLDHRERLYRDCVYLLGYRDQEAEDVVQEAFLTAYRKLPEFEFRSTLGTWLTQIAIYLCYNRYRKRVKQVVQEQAALDGLLESAAMDRDRRQDEISESQYKLRMVKKCLEKIGKECREIIRLRDLEKKSYLDTGLALGIPLGTVMSRLSRCKKALKVLVEQELSGKK